MCRGRMSTWKEPARGEEETALVSVAVNSEGNYSPCLISALLEDLGRVLGLISSFSLLRHPHFHSQSRKIYFSLSLLPFPTDHSWLNFINWNEITHMDKLTILNPNIQQIGADSNLWDSIEEDFLPYSLSYSDKQIVLSLSCSHPICTFLVELKTSSALSTLDV